MNEEKNNKIPKIAITLQKQKEIEKHFKKYNLIQKFKKQEFHKYIN